MICYVDLEHEKVSQDTQRKANWLARRADVQYKLEEISGDACLLQRYSNVTRQKLKEWRIRALILSGCATDWIEYRPGCFDELFEIIRAAELPILGFCGGHQLIAMAHGAPVGPMRRLNSDKKDPAPHFATGWWKESGFTPVHLLQDDPLFAGLSNPAIFLESHYWEIKEPPAGFEVLASTDACRVQAMKRRDKLVYGTQFHPEEYSEKPYGIRSIAVHAIYPGGYPEERSDGRTLIANFFRLAGFAGRAG